MTTARTNDDGGRAAKTPGDNRGADDVDGNKAGAKTGNKAPGPDEPEPEAEHQPKQPRRNA